MRQGPAARGLTRREAILAGLAIPLGAALRSDRSFAATAATLPSPLLATITGANPDSLPSRLAAFYQPLLDRKIAVTLAIAPVGAAGSRLEPQSPLALSLRSVADANPDLFEIAVDVDDLDSPDPYFQLRRASEAQAALTWALNSKRDPRQQSVLTALTLTTTAIPLGLEHLAALRAAGIRTVIHVPDAAAVAKKQPSIEAGYWMTSTGLAKTFALAQTSALSPEAAGAPRPVEALRGGLLAAASARAPIAAHLPLSAFENASEGDIANYAGELAALLAGMRDNGSARPLPPYALYRQSRQGPLQYVIVRVDDLRVDPDDEQAHRRFTMDLLRSGIPVSEAVIPIGYGPEQPMPLIEDGLAKTYLGNALRNAGYEITTHGLNHARNELLGVGLERDFSVVAEGMRQIYQAVGKTPSVYVPPNNAFDGDALTAIAGCGNRMMSGDLGDYRWLWGLDGNGLLRASNAFGFEKRWFPDVPYFTNAEMARFIGARNDAVFTIHPGTASSASRLRQVRDLLATLASQPGVKLVNFSQYYEAVVPKMPLLDLVQGGRAQRRIVDAGSAVVDDALAGDLKADAEVAWRYFDTTSALYKGLSPATASAAAGKIEGYGVADMADIGSMILAYCSAYELGLVDQGRFESLAQTAVEFLGQSCFDYRGALLPPAERSIDGSPAERQGFDAIDAGRLLIALKRLDECTSQSLPAAALVRKWKLEATLSEGEMHDVGPTGEAASVHQSPRALYAARGYALWGFDLKPVFDIPEPADMDGALSFLSELARRGPISSEPWTAEHVELSPSKYTEIVEDILSIAQIRRHRESGYFTGVADVAIDQAPWFLSQGYEPGPDGGAWRVAASTGEAKYESASFAAAMRTVSAKAAFLWLAARPGDYSMKLYRFVREKCRTDSLGFVSGIYEKTSLASRLSDANTNALILEAANYVLRGRKSLLA